jgi:hypothetical protein
MTNETITIEQPGTVNKYGAISFGAASTGIPCRLELGERVFVNAQGVNQFASGMMYVLSTSATMSPQSRVTLSDGRQPAILRVNVMNDEEGQHHLEVMIR